MRLLYAAIWYAIIATLSTNKLRETIMLTFAEQNAEYKTRLYSHPVEVWNAAKCARLAKRKQTDGYGTKDHLAGFIHSNYGLTRYNGIIEREGNLYGSEYRPLPNVAKGFEIVYVESWFYRIIKTA